MEFVEKLFNFVVSYAEWSISLEETGRVGQDIMKGVYYALVLTI